jgi:hypothetical protein
MEAVACFGPARQAAVASGSERLPVSAITEAAAKRVKPRPVRRSMMWE